MIFYLTRRNVSLSKHGPCHRVAMLLSWRPFFSGTGWNTTHLESTPYLPQSRPEDPSACPLKQLCQINIITRYRLKQPRFFLTESSKSLSHVVAPQKLSLTSFTGQFQDQSFLSPVHSLKRSMYPPWRPMAMFRGIPVGGTTTRSMRTLRQWLKAPGEGRVLGFQPLNPPPRLPNQRVDLPIKTVNNKEVASN